MTFNKPIQSIQPDTPMRVINTVKPLKTITPLQLLQYSQQGQSQSDPYAINSLTDALFNKRAQQRKFGDYNFGTILKSGVHHLTQSYLKPLLKGDVVTLGVNSLRSFSEDADVLANVAKGAIIESDNTALSYLVAGVTALGVGAATIASGGTLGVAFAAGAVSGGMSGVAAAIVDDSEAALRGIEKGSGLGRYGKTQYDFDTGNFFLNMAGEVVMDPLNWLSFGSAAILKTNTKIAMEAGEAVAEQGVKLTMRNSTLHLIEKLGAFDDVVTKTAFLTNPLGLSLYGIKQASSPLLSAVSSKFVKTMADFTSKSDILDAQGYNEAINIGLRHAKTFNSEVRKNYPTELMVIPGKDADISRWYRVASKTLQKTFGVEYNKAMDMLDDMMLAYLKGDPDYMIKYVNSKNKAFLDELFVQFDAAGKTKFGAARGYYTSDYKKGMDAISAYAQRLKEGAQSRVLFDESVNRAFFETRKTIQKNIGKPNPTVSEYLVGVRNGLYERFPELAELTYAQAKRRYGTLFQQIKTMYLDDLGISLEDVFGKNNKLTNKAWLDKFSAKVVEGTEDFGKIIKKGVSAVMQPNALGANSAVEQVRKIMSEETSESLTQLEKFFNGQAVPGFEKKLIWEEAKNVVQKSLSSEATRTWLQRVRTERFAPFMTEAFRIHNRLNVKGKVEKALAEKEITEYISKHVTPDQVEYFKTIFNAFAIVHDVAHKAYTKPGSKIAGMDRFIQMYKIASSVDFSDLKKYITAPEDSDFYKIFSEINAIKANLGILEETAVLLNKEGALLMQLNKRFATEFMRNTILDSPAIELFQSLIDTTQPLGMLMEMVSKANFDDEFAEMGARARQVYTSIKGFENYVELSTKLQDAVQSTVEYNPSEKIILDMRHAAWVVDEDDTKIVYRVLWDGETDSVSKQSNYYTFMKDEASSDKQLNVKDLSSLKLITEEEFAEDLRELEALKSQYKINKETRLAREQKVSNAIASIRDARNKELNDIFGTDFNHQEFLVDTFKVVPMQEAEILGTYTYHAKSGKDMFRKLYNYVFKGDAAKDNKFGLNTPRLGKDIYFNDLDSYMQFMRLEDTLGNTVYDPKKLASQWLGFSKDFDDKNIAYANFVEKRLNRLYGSGFKPIDLVIDDEMYDEVTGHMLRHFTETPSKMLSLSNYTDQELISLLGLPEGVYQTYVKPAKEMVASYFDGYSPAYVSKRMRELDSTDVDNLMNGIPVDGIPPEFADYLSSKLVTYNGLDEFYTQLFTPPMILDINKIVSYTNLHNLSLEEAWTNIRKLYNDAPEGYTVIIKNSHWSSNYGHPSGNYTPNKAEKLTELLTMFLDKTLKNGGKGGVRLADGEYVTPEGLAALRQLDLDNAKALGIRNFRGDTISRSDAEAPVLMRVLNRYAPFDNTGNFEFKNLGYSSDRDIENAYALLQAEETLKSNKVLFQDTTAKRIYFDTLANPQSEIYGFSAQMGAKPEHQFLSNFYVLPKGQEIVIEGVEFSSSEAAYQALKFHNVPMSYIGKYTPDNIERLSPGQYIVFGSNEQGVHGAGAALTAKNKFGAVEGKGIGLQGQSYALPTRTWVGDSIHTLDIDTVSYYLDDFIAFANDNRDKTFYMTKVGLGLAGMDPQEITGLFQSKDFPPNVMLPYVYSKDSLKTAEVLANEGINVPDVLEKGMHYSLNVRIPDSISDASLGTVHSKSAIKDRISQITHLIKDSGLVSRETPASKLDGSISPVAKLKKHPKYTQARAFLYDLLGKEQGTLPGETEARRISIILDMLGDSLKKDTSLKFYAYVREADKTEDAFIQLLAKRYNIQLYDISNTEQFARLRNKLKDLREGVTKTNLTVDATKVSKEETLWEHMSKMTPAEAKRFSTLPQVRAFNNVNMDNRKRSIPYRLEIMKRVTDAKYENPILRERLMATGSRRLVEANTWGDEFFGTVDGKGKNYLGQILMKKRQELFDSVNGVPKVKNSPQPKVANLIRNSVEVLKQPGSVYIGRNMANYKGIALVNGGLGNPFTIQQMGSPEAAVKAFDDYLGEVISTQGAKDPKMYSAFMDLVERQAKGEELHLVCWCKPAPCHGDVISRRLKEYVASTRGLIETADGVVPGTQVGKRVYDSFDELRMHVIADDLSPEEYSLRKRGADGYRFNDGRVEIYKNHSTAELPSAPVSRVKQQIISDPKDQELLYGMVLEMLEEFRTKPVAEAMELLANGGEKFFARFQLAPHLAAYEDLMFQMLDHLKYYLRKQEAIGDFNVRTIEMPSGEIGLQIQSLLEQYLPEYVEALNSEGMQQDMYTEALEQLKEQYFRFNKETDLSTTKLRLSEAPHKIQQMNYVAHRYFIRAKDAATASRATATLMSTGRVIGAIGFEKSASPYSGIIQRFVNSSKRKIIELHPELQETLDAMDDATLRKYIYDYDPDGFEGVVGDYIHDKFQAAVNTQAVYENQLNAIGTLKSIEDNITARLMQTTGRDADVLTPLEIYQREHQKMFENGFVKFNPDVKDALYNYQIHGTEMMLHTKKVLEHTVMDPKGTGFMGTYGGHTQSAKNAVSLLQSLANPESPENLRTLAQLLTFHSIGQRVFISKTMMPNFDPRAIALLESEYGIKFIQKDMHYIFDAREATDALKALGPIKGHLARMGKTEDMTDGFIKSMSDFYYKMQESASQTFPLDWVDAPIMRVDDAKIVPYLTDILGYMSREEAVEYARSIQDSGMFGLSILTDVEELSGIFGGRLLDSPSKMAISSGVTLMLHHDAKPRFLNLFFNDNFRLNNFFGTNDPQTIFDTLRSNPDLAIVGLNKDMNARQIPINSVKDVKIALEKNAIITTSRGFIKIYNALDTFKMPKFMDWIERNLTAPFKASAMTSLGLPLRNLLDNNVKLLAYAKGDLDVFTYIPTAYKYMNRFQEMALEMKDIQNPRAVAEYLLKQSPEDQRTFFLMVQAKETAISGAPMDVYLDLSKAERMAAELRSGKTDPSSLIQRISWGNPLTQFALSLQNASEQHWRLAAYLYDINRGKTASEISHRVAEFFIDYSHKTPTMQYLNAIIPFSMFTVKNTLLWAEHALDTPWLLRTLIDASELSWRQSQDDHNSEPSDYEKQQRMSGNTRIGKTLIKTNPSLYDAMMLIPGLIQNPLGRVNPVIKNTAALMQGDMSQIQLPWETQVARAANIFKKMPGVINGTEDTASTLVPSLFGEMKQFDNRGTQYNTQSAKATFNSVYYAAQMSRKRGGSLNSNRTRRNFYNSIWSASGKPRFASTTLQSRMNSISYNYRAINRRIY